MVWRMNKAIQEERREMEELEQNEFDAEAKDSDSQASARAKVYAGGSIRRLTSPVAAEPLVPA